MGIGISPNGGMEGADMNVGWVKNGKVNVTVSDNSSTLIAKKLSEKMFLCMKAKKLFCLVNKN